MMDSKLPVTAPLPHTTIEEAIAWQHRLADAVTEHVGGNLAFQMDVGVNPPVGRPHTTARVENALADAFGVEAAALVQGAGTGAIRHMLGAGPWRQNDRTLLIHDAPIYSTTATTFTWGNVDAVTVDFNDREAFRTACASEDVTWVYIQHTRQQLHDAYDPLELVRIAVDAGKHVLCDENYAAIRTPQLATDVGAVAGAFSTFKLAGPVGVGVVIGESDLISAVHADCYSGGSQVQGDQALLALQQLMLVPVNWAIQSQQVHTVVEQLQAQAIPGVVGAVAANAQDLCIIVEFEEPISEKVQAEAVRQGAAGYPVGSNSRYEICPLFYRMSSSSLARRPELGTYLMRINPMRTSAERVLTILSSAVDRVMKGS